MILKTLYRLLSPSGPDARLSSLIFHRVHPQHDPLFPEEVDARQFDAICGWVRDWFNVLPLDEAVSRLVAGTLPARALSITFDDGYADNHGVAAPILERHRLPCTFFVATGFLDGGRMWNDSVIEAVRRCEAPSLDLRPVHPSLEHYALGTVEQRRAAARHAIGALKYLPHEERLACVESVALRAAARLPDDLMMRSDQVRDLQRRGMQIGAHTVSHPILRDLPRQAARDEIVASRSRLQDILGEPVTLFAYPNGKPGEDYSPESVELVREAGFEAAVSTQWGCSTAATDRFQLRRFSPWNRDRLRFGLRLAGNLRVH